MNKNNNKYFLIILVFFSVFLSACFRTEPEEEEYVSPYHTHTYDLFWSYDLETHYHKANCEHDDLKKDEAKHSFNSSLMCTTCGFKYFLYANDGKAPINLMVGEEITPYSVYAGKDTDYQYISSDPSVAKVIYTGKVTALKAGKTTITAYYKGIAESSVEINVSEKEKVEINIDTTYLNELNDLIKEFSDSNRFSLKIYTKINDQTNGADIKMQTEPFYYESHVLGKSIEEDNELLIIKQEDGKYFMYHDAYYNSITRSYLNDEQLKIEISNLEDVEIGSEFSFSKAEINKVNDNHFIIKMYFLDAGIDYQELFGEESQEIEDALSDTILIFDIERNENILNIKYSTTIRINVGYDVAVIPIDITFQYDIGEIVPYDLSNYTFSPPSNFEETLPSSLGEYIRVNRNRYGTQAQDNYFQYHLEKGTYVFTARGTAQNIVSNYLKFDVYDSSYNQIDVTGELQSFNINNNVIYILEDGDYYFDITIPETGVSGGIEIKLEKCESIEREEKEFKSDSDGLINASDFIKYKYIKENNYELLKFTNTGNNSIYLFITSDNDSEKVSFLEIKKDEVVLINPDLGNNNFYIYAKDLVTYDYSFELEILNYEDNSSNTNIITDEFNEYYSIGLDLPDYTNHTFTISEYGLYKFEVKGYYGVIDCGVIIHEGSATSKKGYYILDVGDYNVTVNYTKHAMDYFQVRYQKIDTNDKEVDLELKELKITESFQDHLPSIQNDNMQILNEQVIKYNFTLDAPTNIIYDPRTVEIYDINDNRISINISSSSFDGSLMHSMRFISGKYYAICIGGTSMSKFVLGYSNEVIDAFDKENTKTLNINEDCIIDTMWAYDARYYKYIPSEDITITINYVSYIKKVLVFTSNYKRVPTINQKTVKLQKGETYYFVFFVSNDSNHTDTYSFTIENGID